jgi:hypothetical protein
MCLVEYVERSSKSAVLRKKKFEEFGHAIPSELGAEIVIIIHLAPALQHTHVAQSDQNYDYRAEHERWKY